MGEGTRAPTYCIANVHLTQPPASYPPRKETIATTHEIARTHALTRAHPCNFSYAPAAAAAAAAAAHHTNTTLFSLFF